MFCPENFTCTITYFTLEVLEYKAVRRNGEDRGACALVSAGLNWCFQSISTFRIAQRLVAKPGLQVLPRPDGLGSPAVDCWIPEDSRGMLRQPAGFYESVPEEGPPVRVKSSASQAQVEFGGPLSHTCRGHFITGVTLAKLDSI